MGSQTPMTSLNQEVEVSIVMPCLNEADTLEICIRKARKALSAANVSHEIIVADNGSTDGSLEIAQRMGVKVVNVAERGYGAALHRGIADAKGYYVIMGDADDSYDYAEALKFVEKLREGFDLVQGCRLPRGGGTILSGAMPWSHRWIGNPMFTFLVHWWFKAPIHDVYCGLRGFTKEWVAKLNLRCIGMEYATEMIIKSRLRGARFAEVPITLHPDGRKAHAPHLKTMRDGWRTLRFFLTYSPKWLFFVPGLFLILVGLITYGVVYSGGQVGHVVFDAHTLLVGSLAIMCGYQIVLFAVFSKIFAVNEEILPKDPSLLQIFSFLTLERGIVCALLVILLGCGLLFGAANQWREAAFGPLDYARTMRWVIPGITFVALGVQSFFARFFISILNMPHR
ncbi:MAG: dolichol-P-glucose synthetase [Lentisphaerae bacterium GWF2_57_35]|nr:MAG: dolichol-P-glucose synthetase [Lentisphaerae bacterium GWF2_57_35]